jgi:hypothetical protein
MITMQGRKLKKRYKGRWKEDERKEETERERTLNGIYRPEKDKMTEGCMGEKLQAKGSGKEATGNTHLQANTGIEHQNSS